MKKLMTWLLTLLLCTPVYAQEYDLPEKILPPEQAALSLEHAITIARQAVEQMPNQARIRANLVQTASGATQWMVTIFDTANLTDAWCVTLDQSAAILNLEKSEAGYYFRKAAETWTAAKGKHALWSLEDKQLFEELYSETPLYGLPLSSDLSAEKALQRALDALDLQDAKGYEVGYYYIKGGDGYNSTWEVNLVEDGLIKSCVSMDAVTGEIIVVITPNPEDDANG